MCKQTASASIHRAALVAALVVCCAMRVSWAAAMPTAPAGSITVTSSADDGPGSLRAAVAAALPNDKIVFNLGANPVITLASGQLLIDKSLIIDGSSAGRVTLAAGPNSRVLKLAGGEAVSVTLVSLVITGGVKGDFCPPYVAFEQGRGGGIFSYLAMLTVRDSVIRGNEAFCTNYGSDSGEGGGIFSFGGTLHVIDTLIESNVTGGPGSAINADTEVTITRSIVQDNVGRYAIDVSDDGRFLARSLHIEQSIIRRNTGARAVIAEVGRLTISASQVVSNAGGGVFMSYSYFDFPTNIQIEIHDSVIRMNGGTGVRHATGTLDIRRSAISDNGGAGVLSDEHLRLWNSTISGNKNGGVITGETAELVNSTVSGNHGVGAYPGGVGHNLAFPPSAHLIAIANSTIVSNTAENPASSGIAAANGTISLQNSIVAGNGITGNFQITGTASLTSLGYNLTNSASGLTGPGDIVGADPLLGPLQANGGPVPTHAPLSNSPVIDAANPGGCADPAGGTLMADGRNYPRPFDGNGDGNARCDIGSVEFWVPSVFRYLPMVMKPEE